MLAWRGVGFGATGPQESCGVRGDLRVTLLALLRVSKQVVPALNLALSNCPQAPLFPGSTTSVPFLYSIHWKAGSWLGPTPQ